ELGGGRGAVGFDFERQQVVAASADVVLSGGWSDAVSFNDGWGRELSASAGVGDAPRTPWSDARSRTAQIRSGDWFIVPIRGGVDPKGGAGAFRSYAAVGEDEFGRRSSSTWNTLNRRAGTPQDGVFRFHYKQGFSFERGALCDVADADLVFSSCAGGISSIT